jgi:hypothetical protein
MKKRLFPKHAVKKLKGKPRNRLVRALEKKIKSTLLEQAKAFADEMCEVEKGLRGLPRQVSDSWRLLIDLRRACLMMEEVVAILQGASGSASRSAGDK